MTDNKKKPTPRELFNEILKHPAYVNEITEYQKSLALEYVAIQFKQVEDRLPVEFKAPDHIDDDKKYDWMLNRSSKYRAAKKVKHIIENHSNSDADESENNQKSDPWNQLSSDIQNRITSFLTGKNKKNKPCYKFLLSVYELNKEILTSKKIDAIPTAVIELANEYDSYKKIEHKPGKQSQSDRISEYRIKNS